MLSVKSKSDTFGRSVACLSVVSSPGFKNRRIFHAPKWDQAACAILSCSWKIDADSIATNFRFHLIPDSSIATFNFRSKNVIDSGIRQSCTAHGKPPGVHGGTSFPASLAHVGTQNLVISQGNWTLSWTQVTSKSSVCEFLMAPLLNSNMPW